MYITSPDNPKIKEYIKLRDNKNFRHEKSQFVIEGFRNVNDAIKNSVKLAQIFVTEKFSENFSEADIITEKLSVKMSDTKSPQGVFAVAEMLTQKPVGGKIFVLWNLQDPGNLGTIIRSADAFGIRDLFSVNSVDRYSPKVVRAAMGSLFRVNITEFDTENVFEALSDYETYAAVLSGYDFTLGQVPFAEKSAIFIGNEGSGLPEEISKRCDCRFTIPMKGNAESLNAAVAASIIMHYTNLN
ncbi:MAG: RNA methyltransferase [Ruminococcus sp.]|jgi:TrmH family RNA methyltransferase|nr:RNA methyltransferase [Ruminococcus sp.]